MDTRLTLKRALLGREVAITFSVIVALYLVRFVQFQPLQIPAYLLIVAYDVIEVVVPVLTPYYPVAFPLFLYLLAIVAASVVRRLGSGKGDRKSSHQAVGGVCLAIGTISLLFGGHVGGPLVVPMDNPTPLAITATTGVILFVVGWWLLRRPTEQFTVSKLRPPPW